MRLQTAGTISTARCFGVVVLSLWLAGIGCLIGCCGIEARAAAPTGAAEQATATTACAHHVQGVETGRTSSSLANEATPEPFAPPPSSGTMPCCPLAGQPTVVTSESRSIDNQAVLVGNACFSPPTPHDALIVAPLVGSSYIQDRGGTYLRCCVFLI